MSGAGRWRDACASAADRRHGEILRDAAVSGLGVALLPTFIAGPAIRLGDLRIVLADHEPSPTAISAVYQASRHLPSKVRVSVEFLRARFGPVPPWDEDRPGAVDASAAAAT